MKIFLKYFIILVISLGLPIFWEPAGVAASQDVSCTPKTVVNCKVCFAGGNAWIDDNSKCPSGQTCSDGSCITSQTSQKIDLLPYLVKSPDLYNSYMEWPRGNRTIHEVIYAKNNDLSGTQNIDMFWVKYNWPAGTEWWQYRASDQTIRHMVDLGDLRSRTGRYNLTGADNAIGGPWLNRYMSPGQVISNYSPAGHYNFYNNDSPNFVPGQLNTTADKFSVNPTLYQNANGTYKTTFGAAGRRDFGGDVGTVDFIQFYYQYPSDYYTPGGTGTEVYTFGKGVGWIGWNMYNIDSSGKWTLENDQPLWVYKADFPAGTLAPAFSAMVPHPYVPAFTEYSPPATSTCIPNCANGQTCVNNVCVTPTLPTGNVSGTVKRNTGEAIPGATIVFGNGQSAVTDSNGNWSANMVSGASYCVRLDSVPIKGYTAVQATGNNSCHVNAPSYEWQVAGQNQYSGCSYSDQRSWDLSSDTNFNFTVIYPASSSCTPNCTNKSCGDNGCGGSCGTCVSGQTCSSGVCVTMCAPKTCSSLNYKCGSVFDGCGNTLSCGGCLTGQACTNGQCVASPACVPKTCASIGYKCGKTGDGCGSVLDCGSCATNQTCSNGACVAGFTCVSKTCASIGYSCGKTDDGCGSALVCGNCPADQECVSNACQATALTQTMDNADATLASLYAQIEYLQSEITRVTNLIKAKNSSTLISCSSIGFILYYGMKNDPQVKCLQEFLKSQGLFSGSATGNYYAFTQNAVVAFQQKYASEILAPYGLTSGSGNVGDATRAKINQILGGK